MFLCTRIQNIQSHKNKWPRVILLLFNIYITIAPRGANQNQNPILSGTLQRHSSCSEELHATYFVTESSEKLVCPSHMDCGFGSFHSVVTVLALSPPLLFAPGQNLNCLTLETTLKKGVLFAPASQYTSLPHI